MKQSCPGKKGYPPRRVNFTERLFDNMLLIFKPEYGPRQKQPKHFVYDSLILKFLKLFLLK